MSEYFLYDFDIFLKVDEEIFNALKYAFCIETSTKIFAALYHYRHQRSGSTKIFFAESIPSEVRKFYGSLNAEEKTALKEYAKDLKQGTANFSLTDNIADGIKVSVSTVLSKEPNNNY